MSESLAVLQNDKNYVKISNAIYLPGLNGLRAIAALGVVISHITIGLGQFGLNNRILGTNADGNASGLLLAGYGVTIFFTLSGFLITYLILKEKETGRLKVRDFYIRRILRIWPLYYLYFILCLASISGFGIAFNASSVPFYIFFAPNIPFIIERTLPFLGHYWSLGVEEQFYLFFPQIAKSSNKRLLKIAVFLIIVFIFIKLLFWVGYRKYDIKVPFVAISVTSFHTMLIGVVGALLYYHRNRRFISFTTHKLIQLISWGCILLIAINKFHIASVIDHELVSVVGLMLIMGQITKRNLIINLENRLCDFVGKISYGMYVVHPLIIFYSATFLGHFSNTTQNYFFVYFLNLAATIIVAYLSYEFYEKRFLKLKAKYATIKSLNTKDYL